MTVAVQKSVRRGHSKTNRSTFFIQLLRASFFMKHTNPYRSLKVLKDKIKKKECERAVITYTDW